MSERGGSSEGIADANVHRHYDWGCLTKTQAEVRS